MAKKNAPVIKKISSLQPKAEPSPWPKELVAKAKVFDKAERSLGDAFADFYNDLPPLPEERYWELLTVFRFILSRGPYWSGKINVEEAIHEFYRKALAKDFRDGEYVLPSYTLYEAMQMGSQFEEISGELTDLLEHLDFDKSDDGWHDFTDALPLAGKVVLENARAKKYGDPEQVYRDIRLSYDEVRNKPFEKLICDGESAFAMYFRDKAQEFFIPEVTRDESDD